MFMSLLYSPLDQFIDAKWTLFSKTFISNKVLLITLLENNYFPISLISSDIEWGRVTGTSSFFLENIYNWIITNIKDLSIFSFFFIFFIYYNHRKNIMPLFRIFFVLFFVNFFTMGLVFFWFWDIFIYQANSLVSYTNINFSFSVDEYFISFISGFFFLSGSEGEEEENFILQEETTYIGELIAGAMYHASLGKGIKNSGALYLTLNLLFLFIFFNNFMGLLPYADTPTSSLILTFWVASVVFLVLVFYVLQTKTFTYFLTLFLPSGTTFELMLLLIPIEFISYAFRLVSLSVRLFANMFAGHTLLKVIIGFSWIMILSGDIMLLMNIIPALIIFLLTFLEFGVALVQTYIFVVLTSMYLKDIDSDH